MCDTVDEIRTYLLNLRDEYEQDAALCRSHRRDAGAPLRAADCDNKRRVVERILREMRL